jgi:ribonucleoside-diphosphate reductase alpha chain/ribonucleoside-triphosphate reductase
MFGFVNSDGTYDKQSMLEAQRLSARMGYRMATIELELHTWDLVNKEDRLTGCSLTGVMDFVNATKMSNKDLGELLLELKEVAIEEVNKLADSLGMNRSKLVTCNKPSGTISQLPVVSSGVHFSHSPYYIRRVRVSSNDPLAKVMCDSGFKWSPEVGQTEDNHSIKVFEFPVKAPEGKTKYEVSAIEQLELYKLIMRNYVQHNASNTIHVRPNEWDEVEQWVWDNWDEIVGVTFLSLDDSFYQLLPYEAITKEQYETMIAETPKMNLALLKKYETFEEFEIMESDCTSSGCPVK